MSPLALYTDGSINQCPGVGGFAVVTEDEILAVGVEMSRSTSTRLEGLALVTALHLTCTTFAGKMVVIYTDSSLWVRRYEDLLFLRDSDWRSKCGKKVKDLDILTSMLSYHDPERVSVQWVKAHSGVRGNDFADSVAKEANRFAQNLKEGKLTQGKDRL